MAEVLTNEEIKKLLTLIESDDPDGMPEDYHPSNDNKLNIDDIKSLFKNIRSTVIDVFSQNDIDRLLCSDNDKEKIDMFSIDFFEIDCWSFRDKLSDKLLFFDLLSQAEDIAIDENESNEMRAEAFVRAYQLLEINYTLAPELLKCALKLMPDMPLALVVMGIHYSHEKDKKRAFECLDRAIEVDPLYPYSWLKKGDFEMNKNNKIYYYSEFIKLKPDSRIGYSNRIFLIEDKIFNKKPIKALLENSEIIKQYIEDNAELLNLNGFEVRFNNCLVTFHNWFCDLSNEKTINVLNIINDFFPKNTTAYWLTQLIYAKAYEYNNEETALKKYSEIIDADNIVLRIRMYCYYKRSKIYSWKKEYEKALNDTAMLLELYPQLPKMDFSYRECNIVDIRKERIDILKEMKEIDKVIQEYSYILEKLENDKNKINYISEIYMKRAIYYQENNYTEKALADFSKVIELGVNGFDHSINDAYAARIKIYKERGEMEKAFADYIKMSELKEYHPLEKPDFRADDFHAPQYKIIE